MEDEINADNPFRTAALAYAARGWHVLPCRPGGKEPLGRLAPHGVKDATTDSEKIRRWWMAAPDANVAVACGRSGLVVVDCEGPAGVAAFVNWCDAHDVKLEGVPCVETPRTRGRHYYFRAGKPPDLSIGPMGYILFDDKGKGIVEVRDNESYVVAPPSRWNDE